MYTDGSGSLTTSYFMGGAYEVRSDGTTLKYYVFAGMTVAMDDGSGLKYFLTDHLGSVVAVTDAAGALLSQQRYMPFGQVRTDVGEMISQTDLGYTSQRNLDAQGNQYSLGLMDYRARFYSPYLARFTQADTIVPGAGNPQAFDRYTYGLNNPLKYYDPDGHFAIIPLLLVAAVTVGVWLIAAPPAYAPSSYEDLVSRTYEAESRWQTKLGRWIDDHPIEYVAIVTLLVYGGIEATGALADAFDDEVSPSLYDHGEPKQISNGNNFHYGEGGGPDQLDKMYPDSEFRHARRGQAGPDVEFSGGRHPSEYPNSSWDPDNDYGDFKTDKSWSEYKFGKEIESGKLPQNTQPLPYNPGTGKLKTNHKFGPFNRR